MDEFDAKTRAARGEAYRQMGQNQRAALATRDELVAATRPEMERSMAEVAVRRRTQTAAVRSWVEREACLPATRIVGRVPGRKAS